MIAQREPRFKPQHARAHAQDEMHGRQTFMRLEFWSLNGAPSEMARRGAQRRAEEERRAAEPVQMGLFAGGAT